MNLYVPADRPTMAFIGVTTGASAIMRVFPAWCEALGIAADLKGYDFPPNAPPADYREAITFIKHDARTLGGLVTTHKMTLLAASRDLFDTLDANALALGEISAIAKRDGRLIGSALDPISVGLAMDAIVDDGYWRRSRGHLLLLGSGGAALATVMHLHNAAAAGRDVPQRVVVTGLEPAPLRDVRAIHARLGNRLALDTVVTPVSAMADAIVAELPPRSMIVNATGLGKDRPGSPLSDAVSFPKNAIAWDFNYRGDLAFLHQARRQDPARGVRGEDGWIYFIHGWTRAIADVFGIEIATRGPQFEQLSRIAREVTARQ